MIRQNAKDFNKRKLIFRYEHIRKMLKYLIASAIVPAHYKIVYNFVLQNFPRNSSKVRAKNFCIFTGRSRGLIGSFRMSRNFFKKHALSGNLVGITKSSW